MKKAYHESRAPLLVNSNWWLAFHNDPAIPDDVILGRPSSANGGITDWQVRRAAWLVSRVLDWKSRLDRQDMYPDTTRAGIWLRNTTAKIFSISRVPQTRCDTLSPLPAPTDSDARKLLVLVHDWFYAVEVVDDDSRFLSSDELERRLSAVVADVVARLENGEHAVPVCVLSADDRDRWTEVRHARGSVLRLMNKSAEPRSSIISLSTKSCHTAHHSPLSFRTQSRSLHICPACRRRNRRRPSHTLHRS